MRIDLDAKDLAQILWALDCAQDYLFNLSLSEANTRRMSNLEDLIDKLRAHKRSMP